MTKLEVLRRYFGHKSFREAQEQLIDAVLGGRDCLGVMPTGAGKSLCYQIPAVMMSGTVIVVSPLISLMKDQVEALVQNGVNAACINSSMDDQEIGGICRRAAEGGYDILYVAPERLGTPRFTALVSSLEIPLVAVDEAHCVSHWGQDFRPSYMRISSFVRSMKKRPVVAAFTATATERVKSDIVEMLGLCDPFCVTTGFDRPNLFFEVRRPSDKDGELLALLKERIDGSVIVYCSTRSNVEKVCAMLCRNGIRAGQYHAGFSNEYRTQMQEDFLFDRLDVMVATNAFGMGIDKSNVRLVVHYNCPKDLESYYQEAGRAGRDGGSARCVMFYNDSDRRVAEFMIERSHSDADLSDNERNELIERDKTRLRAIIGYCKSKSCQRAYILNYFGESAGGECGNCGNCTKGYTVSDVTVESQMILSCVYRLKQHGRALPVGDVCNILCGKLSEGGLDKLSTFGLMRDADPKRVLRIAEYLTAEGYIDECGENKICVLTPKADEFIKSRGSVIMRFKAEKKKPSDGTVHNNPELFEQLRALRKTLSSNLGVPPYVVFSDASLWSMCTILPKNIDEFLKVSGVGTMKAERYGRKFIAVIGKYTDTRRL